MMLAEIEWRSVSGLEETIYCPEGRTIIPDNPLPSAIPLRTELVNLERENGKNMLPIKFNGLFKRTRMNDIHLTAIIVAGSLCFLAACAD
jgi:hypothetical protein